MTPINRFRLTLVALGTLIAVGGSLCDHHSSTIGAVLISLGVLGLALSPIIADYSP